jgi:predicted transcriptional regulator
MNLKYGRRLSNELRDKTERLDERMAQEYSVIEGQEGNTQKQNQLVRRSRLETYGDILYAVSVGATKPTHIMYKANLSWVVMKEYLKSLEQFGLITSTETNGNRIYHLSDGGFRVLKQFLEVKDELKLTSE